MSRQGDFGVGFFHIINLAVHVPYSIASGDRNLLKFEPSLVAIDPQGNSFTIYSSCFRRQASGLDMALSSISLTRFCTDILAPNEPLSPHRKNEYSFGRYLYFRHINLGMRLYGVEGIKLACLKTHLIWFNEENDIVVISFMLYCRTERRRNF